MKAIRLSAAVILSAALLSIAAFADEWVTTNGETNVFKCVGPKGATRYTKGLAVATGEKCQELTKKQLEKMQADSKRPPTEVEKAQMDMRAAKMEPLRRCTELGRVLRKPDPTPKGEYWANAVVRYADVTQKDLVYIQTRQLKVGLDECSVVAILGAPDDAKTTHHATGRSVQLVYRSTGIYVYIENGIVTSWQD